MFCRSSNFCRRTSLILDPKILQTCFFDWSTESDESYCMLLISWNDWNCIYLEIMKMGVGTSTSVLLAAMPFSLRQSHWSDWSKTVDHVGQFVFPSVHFRTEHKEQEWMFDIHGWKEEFVWDYDLHHDSVAVWVQRPSSKDESSVNFRDDLLDLRRPLIGMISLR